MILGVLLFAALYIKAHELIAPAVREHDNDWRKHIDDIGIMQLHGLFSRSRGIVHRLPDRAFSATDIHHETFAAKFARLNQETGRGRYWAAKKGETNAITVDMTTSFLVTGVATRGVASTEYVRKYSVETSENGHTWRSHGFFVGNFDGATICRVRFNSPVFARFVRFKVLEFKNHPSMTLDVLVYERDN